MTRRFSPQELYFLRNKVPVKHVIVNLLSIPSHKESDKLRFACPLCHGFKTSIHPKENLGRCFSCRQSFNPIEIVMHHLKRDFVNSVKWLKCRTIDLDHSRHSPQKTPLKRNASSTPSQIGDILSGILPSLSQKAFSVSKPATLEKRIENLEKKVDKIYKLIEELRTQSTF